MNTATLKRTEKIVAKFLTMAERLDADAADRFRPRLDNTPKRARETMSARIDGNHYKRAAKVCRSLAIGHAKGTLPLSLMNIKTKAEVLTMTRTHIDCVDYYTIRDTDRFCDTSPLAVELRALAQQQTDKREEDERRRLQAIEELERQIRFAGIPDFFPTPPAIVERMMGLADVRSGHTALEPSAGKGDIAEALRSAGAKVLTCELNPTPAQILTLKGFEVTQCCFLERFGELTKRGPFDRIVMNPPFSNLADIDHVRKAFDFLKPGGRLVSVMSPGPFFRQDRKATEFREWFETRGGIRSEVEAGAFKSAFCSTGVATCLVVIDN